MNSCKLSPAKWTTASVVVLLSSAAGAQISPDTRTSGTGAQPADPTPLLLSESHDVVVPEATTDWHKVATLPRFDPALGILRRIETSFVAKVLGDAAAENLEADESDVTLEFAIDVTLARPHGGILAQSSPFKTFHDHLLPFDGTVDFGGPSGVSHPGLDMEGRAESVTELGTDLALFTGQANHPGTIDLQISAVGTSTAEGRSMVSQFRQMASAVVSVTYFFEPDCNQNGVSDIADAASGTSPDANGNLVPDECEPAVTLFCFGDGPENGGPECPCGNSVPGNTAGCLNSTGVGARLEGMGVPSIQNDTLHLSSTHLPPGVPTFYLQGTATMNSGQGVIFHEGLRCIGGGITRVAKVQSSPESGGPLMFPGDDDPPISELLGIAPGQTRFYQVWYRSPGGPCEMTVNTTNAVGVVWGF